MGYPTDYPTQPGAFWSTLLRLLTCCLVMRLQISWVVSYLNRYGFPFLDFSLRQYLKVAVWRRGFNRNLSKDISLRKMLSPDRRFLIPTPPGLEVFCFFSGTSITSLIACCGENSCSGVSALCVQGSFVTYQLLTVIVHSSLLSLDVDFHSCSPCYFPFPSVFFHFYPHISFLFQSLLSSGQIISLGLIDNSHPL